MFLSESTNNPVGLDISDLSLKIFQLKKTGNKISIQALNKVDLPKGLIEDGEVIKKEEVLKELNRLFENPKYGKVDSMEVVASLPESKTFIKLIEIENSPNDLGEVIKTEIEKYIPLAIDEIYYDWQVIKSLPDKKLILLGAAPKNIVDQYSELIDEAGLSLSALEIESIALCRCLLNEESNNYKNLESGSYGIIDIGSRLTNMVVYAEKTILFTVSMPICGDEITQSISKTLKIDYEQAEKAKIICGLDDNRADGVIKNILSEVLNELIDRINEVQKYQEYHFPSQPKISQIYLCGGGSNIVGLDKIIESKIGVKVNFGNPFNNLGIKESDLPSILTETHSLNLNFSKDKKNKDEQTISQDTSLAFSTAIGLALRGVFVDEI